MSDRAATLVKLCIAAFVAVNFVWACALIDIARHQ